MLIYRAFNTFYYNAAFMLLPITIIMFTWEKKMASLGYLHTLTDGRVDSWHAIFKLLMNIFFGAVCAPVIQQQNKNENQRRFDLNLQSEF